MKYIIMLFFVIGLVSVDFIMGIIKAYLGCDMRSSEMRKGGVRKMAELLIMLTACGFDIGINYLGNYFNCEQLADIGGTFTSVAVFGYIVIMELISILENYADINPRAAWASKILKRLRTVNEKEENQ